MSGATQNGRPRALLILGMHRSGTSATTRVVNLLGAELGSNLISPGPDNPDGFWEHADVVAINEELLGALGRTWYDMREMPDNWLNSPAAMQARDKILELIAREFSSKPLVALKDPRMCLTSALWISALEQSGFEPLCLFVVRDPREVVNSLHVRNDWARDPLYLMWVQYVVEAVAGAEGCRRTIITFDQLLSDWSKTMGQVALDLVLTWPNPFQGAAEEIDTFLDKGRRHHVAVQDDGPQKDGDGMPYFAKAVYDACLNVAAGHQGWGEISVLESRFREIAGLYAAHVDELLKQRWGAEGRAVNAEAKLIEASEASKEFTQLNEFVTERIRAAVLAIDGLALKLDAAQEALRRDNEGVTARLQLRLDQMEAGLEQRLDLLKVGMDERAEELKLIAKRVEDADQEKIQLLEQIKKVIQQKDASTDFYIAELSRRDAVINEIMMSSSWRITAPMRWLVVNMTPKRLKANAGRVVRWGYHHLPLASTHRLAIKRALFRAAAPLIRNTRSYRAWKEYEAVQQQNLTAQPSVAISTQPLPLEQEQGASYVLRELYERAAGSSDEYVPLDDAPVDTAQLDVRAIAFYLPQFHPIPENDEWWGKGFTEWTNVSKAMPQFIGHYQPHLPGELGFYDLRIVDIMRRQVELARHYGVQGFCFHYYWFAGRRLLERPLEQFLVNRDIDFPFCICWANENWTRRWDGLDQEMLVAQQYSAEDDIAFISALESLLRDPRYIKVDGRPLIILYRPSILPDARATLERWREHCRKIGIGEIFAAMVQFDVDDPRTYGFDAAIEFPPHKLARGLGAINQSLQIVNPEYAGHVVDYASIVARARDCDADYPMFRGVFPCWDNEARKPGRGYTFANATPSRYREWLDLAIDYARRKPVVGERMLFINAWNEWAEGAHLEPDRRYGYAFLNATRGALKKRQSVRAERVLIVSHDAHPHGAQYLALNMARQLHDTFHFSVEIVLLGAGHLKDEFARAGRVHDLTGKDPLGAEARALAEHLFASGVRHAVANTTVSGLFAQTLKNAGLSVVGLVHELPGVIRDHQLGAHALSLSQHADYLVFPAESVRDGFAEFAETSKERSIVRAQGLYKINRLADAAVQREARVRLRKKLGLSDNVRIVLCVGYADLRKGVDLFVEIGRRVIASHPDVHFLWVGHSDISLRPDIDDAVKSTGVASHFHFPGRDADTDLYYAGADIYALTSREDPFPSVVMEAMQVGVPIVGFRNAGGFVTLLEEGAGLAVPHGDVEAFAAAVANLLDNPEQTDACGRIGRAVIEDRYDFRAYLFDLLKLVGIDLPRVSVVVPNYNYAHYLPQRLGTIIEQRYPYFELIVLDDSSNDNSIAVVKEMAAKRGVHIKTVVNASNSGSVFKQWLRGAQVARGEYVWIAEADDLADTEFLANLVQVMDDQQVVMAYCQSTQIDENGNTMADHYRAYTNDISPGRWLTDYRTSGQDEIKTCLTVKNTIPNVSSVLFRRDAILSALVRDIDLICSFRIAGDWIAYMAVLEQGDIAYVADALNQHRRHRSSVTLGGAHSGHMLEVLRAQGIARKRYGPSSGSVEKARQYAASLYRHFGLTDKEVEEIESKVKELNQC